MRKLLTIFILFGFANLCTAQSYELFYTQFFNGGRSIKTPYLGGMRAPQFSAVDLDDDGKKDMVVFDRNSNSLLTFLNKGADGEINYEYDPSYESWFPANTQSWMLMYDFDGDGLEDLFRAAVTLGLDGIEVWKTSRNNGVIEFTPMRFSGNPSLSSVLQIPISSGGFTQLYVASIDLPALFDVDGDGDMDILSFEADGSYMNYYKNQSQELGFGRDSLRFALADFCFGKFYENATSEEIFLSEDGLTCAFNFGPGTDGGVRHAGSCITAFDNDCDGLADILLGDLLNNRIFMLDNKGSRDRAWIRAVDNRFPSYDVPADIDLFLSAFHVDVNNDGKRDLIVAPNERDNAQTLDHIWLYLNEGTDCAPIFRLHTKNFLVEESLFFHTASHPVVFDYNADGLLDVLIGTNGIRKKNQVVENRMYLLENIGTKTNPVFNIVQEDYLEMSRNAASNSIRLAPALGDLDGDGDDDMVIGDSRGFLYYLENTAALNQAPNFATPRYMFGGIFTGQNASPHIEDIDGDGLGDLIVGKRNNEVILYKNIGTVGNPQFNSDVLDPVNVVNYGKIFGTGSEPNAQNGSPFIFTTEDKRKMAFGTNLGTIRLFGGVSEDPNANFSLETLAMGDINVGRRSNPALADLDDNGFYELLIGTERGGLHIYRTPLPVAGMVSTTDLGGTQGKVTVFPNPMTSQLWIQTEAKITQIAVQDLFGRSVDALLNAKNIGEQQVELDVNRLENGVYVLTIQTAAGHSTHKVVKL